MFSWLAGNTLSAFQAYGIVNLHEEYEPLIKRPVLVSTLALPAGDCAWHSSSSGGCSVCGFNSKHGEKAKLTRGGKPWPNFAMRALIQFNKKIVSGLTPEVLSVFHGGSFFNPDEIPLSIQRKIVDIFFRSRNYKKLFLESRPEFITNERLALLTKRKTSKEKFVQVGIGLESSNDYVRNGIINKGMALDSFLTAVKTLKEMGISTFAYIFLKPHRLTERQAIEDAVSSASFCFENGVDVVSFSCAIVQKGTILHDLWSDDKYRPPWLWSVIEVVLRAREIADKYGFHIRLGSFTDDPPPVAIPYNCPKCSSRTEQYLESFRKTNIIEHLKKIDDCECKSSWLEEVGK